MSSFPLRRSPRLAAARAAAEPKGRTNRRTYAWLYQNVYGIRHTVNQDTAEIIKELIADLRDIMDTAPTNTGLTDALTRFYAALDCAELIEAGGVSARKLAQLSTLIRENMNAAYVLIADNVIVD